MADQHQLDAGLPNFSISPEHESQSSPDAPVNDHNDPSRRMSALNLGFLKNLTDKRGSRDGSQPKKRGPKPDSKPALTRRQELNRQAQRTHRERKEQYVKALEDEVVRLKDIYSGISQDKTRLADENQRLKDLLHQHGIPFHSDEQDDPGNDGDGSHNGHPSHAGGSNHLYPPGSQSQGSLSPGQASSTTGGSASPYAGHATYASAGQQLRSMTQQATAEKGMDYNQAGIDFVLTLERPCMNHLPLLIELTHETGAKPFMPSGHALMASCPPQPLGQLPSSSAFSTQHLKDNVALGQGSYDLSPVDLASLMDLSARIDLDGEITPIMAWGMIMSHPNFKAMQPSDLRALAEQLGPKMRCFGFGAVTEEFEVRDAIAGVLCNPSTMIGASA